jgi:hypothetical protein
LHPMLAGIDALAKEKEPRAGNLMHAFHGGQAWFKDGCHSVPIRDSDRLGLRARARCVTMTKNLRGARSFSPSGTGQLLSAGIPCG